MDGSVAHGSMTDWFKASFSAVAGFLAALSVSKACNKFSMVCLSGVSFCSLWILDQRPFIK